MAERNNTRGARVLQDLIGQTFGRLTVLEQVVGTRNGRFFRCRCECGTEKAVSGSALIHGDIVSCGCWRRERAGRVFLKHGAGPRRQRSPEYSSWRAMIKRCYEPKSRGYDRYGGSGITVCGRWRESFETFLADMGPRPSRQHSIDRFPNQQGGYEPGNCRWATAKEQGRNTKTNVMLEFRGETRCMSEWGELLGIPISTLHNRLHRGWSVERALSTPPRREVQPYHARFAFWTRSQASGN